MADVPTVLADEGEDVGEAKSLPKAMPAHLKAEMAMIGAMPVGIETDATGARTVEEAGEDEIPNRSLPVVKLRTAMLMAAARPPVRTRAAKASVPAETAKEAETGVDVTEGAVAETAMVDVETTQVETVTEHVRTETALPGAVGATADVVAAAVETAAGETVVEMAAGATVVEMAAGETVVETAAGETWGETAAGETVGAHAETSKTVKVATNGTTAGSARSAPEAAIATTGAGVRSSPSQPDSAIRSTAIRQIPGAVGVPGVSPERVERNS
ncbi:MAG: hypothetical protein ACI84D_003702 [Thalassolituus oleivorans]|jgi:hypothetical protein